MSLTPSQAADSLKEIEQTGRRSASAFGYAKASPFFILWGILWMVGYAGSGLLVSAHLARHIGWLWGIVSLAGIAIGFVIRRGQEGGDISAAGARQRRVMGSIVVIILFMFASFAVMNPRNGLAQAAFVPLVVSLFYGLVGLWKGARFVVAGAVVAALTLLGFFFLREHFLLWMAVVGGGSLVLVGIWLRKV